MGADVIVHRVNKDVDINTRNIHRNYNLISDNIDDATADYYIFNIKGKSGAEGKIILPRNTTNLIVFG